uniref:Thiamin biosynthesis protein S n=1 Tax=Cliftonaea pectinata TaxID=2007206 RepID=A0A1Z1MQK1_9FLOR|nr:thiamin biosynthesis protein S [Cliftonaea pectinata]ARW68149.1 thiamin biosynthesis protein S [Cliftonaea pectinata]
MTENYSTIFVNGEPFNCYDYMSIKNVLLYLDFDINNIVVECNHQIVNKDKFDKFLLKSNDQIEVITIVGGG